MDEKIYQIALTLIPGIGDVLARNLVSYCGSVEAVFKQKKSQLTHIPGIGEKLANEITRFSNFNQAEAELKFIQKHQIQTHFYLDNTYPKRLKQIGDAPILLYSLGNVNLDAKRIVAIVGTRKASEYGKSITEKIVETLVPTDALILSGLALGIDVAAHRHALKQGLNTVGVVAHGLDRIYPSQHKNLAKQMLENGGLLTEFPSGTIPDRENFPKRNRIVAGLCDVLIVVETGIKGGAMITAEIANSYNKEIMSVPGRINDDNSFGNNVLIKLNKASILTMPEDVLQLMGWEGNSKTKVVQQAIPFNLEPIEQEIVDIVKSKTKVGIDDIACTLQMDSGNLSLTLLDMEFKGIIKQLPGKFYQLV
ncbi:MAG: DNA-processing protein DprA [Bacteroidia bacterium]|nr:DNA-processing protein DprA [Bacteroidia bacterium]